MASSSSGDGPSSSSGDGPLTSGGRSSRPQYWDLPAVATTTNANDLALRELLVAVMKLDVVSARSKSSRFDRWRGFEFAI